MNYAKIIEEIYQQILQINDLGKVASYIPELSKINPEQFGICLVETKENRFGIGNYQERFSIQSIAKVLSLSLAYKILGEKIWERVGVEPSGTGFNSLVQLEADKGIPRNPFINAGAMVVADMLISLLDNPKQDFLEYVRSLSNNEKIDYCERIAKSEKRVGYTNIAICNFLKSYKNIDNAPEKVLDFYFDLCSLEMNCEELADSFLIFANYGCKKNDDTRVLTISQSKRINALMQTCGFYDESGEFAFKVGLPGKSGVGGGIVAIHPNRYAIAVWSPRLNDKGNSFKGMRFLEKFTTKSQLSIF